MLNTKLSKSTLTNEHLIVVKDVETHFQKRTYKKRFIGRLHNTLFSVSVKDVGYLTVEDNTIILVTRQLKRIIVQQSLNLVESQVHSDYFFRINRKTLVHINSIEGIHIISNSRIKVRLHDKSEHLISRSKGQLFKEWLDI